jgi:hypothetical protein
MNRERPHVCRLQESLRAQPLHVMSGNRRTCLEPLGLDRRRRDPVRHAEGYGMTRIAVTG